MNDKKVSKNNKSKNLRSYLIDVIAGGLMSAGVLGLFSQNEDIPPIAIMVIASVSVLGIGALREVMGARSGNSRTAVDKKGIFYAALGGAIPALIYGLVKFL